MRFPRGARTGGSAAVPRAILIACLSVISTACATTAEVARLQEEVRRLQAAVDEAQKREAETQVRVQEMRDKAAAGAAQAGAAAPAERAADTPQGAVEKPPAGASPHELYNAAFTRYNLGQHLEAIQLFHSFIAAYPKHDLADNAQYWVGECYFSRQEYDRAVEEFQKVVDEYPQGNKVPDAFVKKALALLALKRRGEAVESLQAVIQTFPRSDAAAFARQRLSEIQKGERPATRR